jgi:hypothetical protein
VAVYPRAHLTKLNLQAGLRGFPGALEFFRDIYRDYNRDESVFDQFFAPRSSCCYFFYQFFFSETRCGALMGSDVP